MHFTCSPCTCSYNAVLYPVQGEILRTRGGGTSVQFTDVEVLHHSRPKTPATRDSARRSIRIASRGRSSSRPGPYQRKQAGYKSEASMSSVSSLSSDSSPESSVNEEYTDTETRVSLVAVT